MLTKVMKNMTLVLFLAMLYTPLPMKAETLIDNASPYKLKTVTAKSQPSSDYSLVLNAFSQTPLYKLNNKFRSQSKPFVIKDTLPEKTLLIEPQGVSMADNINIDPNLKDTPFSDEIELAAHAAALDPSLVHAVIFVESRYRHRAISPKGAVGLMQVMPDTAARYGLRHAIYLPKENIKAGTYYLRDLMAIFDNRIELVLAAYNAGEGAVKKYAKNIPPYPETRSYVKAVMAKYASNTRNNEWKSINNNDYSSRSIDSQHAAQMPTHYLAGTALGISSESYKLNH